MNNWILKLGGLLTICFLLGLIVNNCTNSYKYNKVLDTEQKSDSLSIQDSVKRFIRSMNLSHPDIVYAQIVLETGNFTSSLYKENHNLFGMKEPLVRNTVALGTKNGYAYYKNDYHSIIDYALYQATYYNDRGRSFSRQSYLEKIARIYAKDTSYISKLTKIINDNKEEF